MDEAVTTDLSDPARGVITGGFINLRIIAIIRYKYSIKTRGYMSSWVV